jgi:hypothetical protein
MKLLRSTLPFSALAITFLSLGVIFSDPRQFSFGIVWLIIAGAKHTLLTRKENVKRSN